MAAPSRPGRRILPWRGRGGSPPARRAGKTGDRRSQREGREREDGGKRAIKPQRREAAQDIDWIEPPKQVFDPHAGVYGRWFTGGVCNTCWNAVDRHVLSGRGEQAAIIYDSPLAGQKRTITYHRLQVETQVLAAIL